MEDQQMPDADGSAASAAAGPSIGLNHAATLDVAGYERVATSGSVDDMALFIERVVRSRGGSIRDPTGFELRRLAFRFATNGSGGGSPAASTAVLGYRHLLHELEGCDWVQWGEPPSGGGGGGGGAVSSSAAGCCGDGGGSADCSGSGAGPTKGGCSGAGGCCASPSHSEFLFGPSSCSAGGEQPSAPPAMDVDSDGAAAAQAVSNEVRLDGTDLRSWAAQQLGPLAIYQPAGMLGILTQRLWRPPPYVVVLLHPTDSSRGIRLFQAATAQQAAEAARAIADALNLTLEGPRVEQETYETISNNPELLEAVSLNLQQEQQGAPASSSSSAAASSSSSSAGPPPAAAAAADSAASAQPAAGEEADDCPICMGAIEPSSAAMRCSGDAGRHHYFHSACMHRWIAQCRQGRAGATCPVCRGHIQFHAQRLDEFLSGRESAGLAEEDRTFLQQCADRLRSVAGGSWGEAFTLQNAKHWGGIAAAGGWGFVIGYTQPPFGLQQQLTLDTLPREHRVAQGIGWILGAIVRILRDVQRERERERERERDRGSDCRDQRRRRS